MAFAAPQLSKRRMQLAQARHNETLAQKALAKEQLASGTRVSLANAVLPVVPVPAVAQSAEATLNTMGCKGWSFSFAPPSSADALSSGDELRTQVTMNLSSLVRLLTVPSSDAQRHEWARHLVLHAQQRMPDAGLRHLYTSIGRESWHVARQRPRQQPGAAATTGAPSQQEQQQQRPARGRPEKGAAPASSTTHSTLAGVDRSVGRDHAIGIGGGVGRATAAASGCGAADAATAGRDGGAGPDAIGYAAFVPPPRATTGADPTASDAYGWLGGAPEAAVAQEALSSRPIAAGQPRVAPGGAARGERAQPAGAAPPTAAAGAAPTATAGRAGLTAASAAPPVSVGGRATGRLFTDAAACTTASARAVRGQSSTRGAPHDGAVAAAAMPAQSAAGEREALATEIMEMVTALQRALVTRTAEPLATKAVSAHDGGGVEVEAPALDVLRSGRAATKPIDGGRRAADGALAAAAGGSSVQLEPAASRGALPTRQAAPATHGRDGRADEDALEAYGGGGVAAQRDGLAVYFCQPAWDADSARQRWQALLRFDPGVSSGDHVLVAGPEGEQMPLLIPLGLQNVQRVVASLPYLRARSPSRAEGSRAGTSLRVDICPLGPRTGAGDRVMVRGFPLTLPPDAVPNTSVVVALPVELEDGAAAAP